MTAVDRWTQSTVWYLFIPVMQKYGIKVTRKYVTRLIRVVCEELGVTREELGIIASPRASMYFNRQWTSVSFDNVSTLAENGTHVIFIEKQDIVEVLTIYADKYGVALVNTVGHLTEYGKDLVAAAKQSGAHVAILTDYDASGIKIASEIPEEIPRLGVDEEMLEYFGLSKKDKQLSISYSPKKGVINPVIKLVKGKRDGRFENIDMEFLKHKRIEIDAVLAVVGSERLWEYLMYKLKKLFPTINYNRVTSSSPGSPSNYYPEPIKKFYRFIESCIDSYIISLFKEEEKKIESELENVKDFIDIADKRREIHKRYRKIAENDPRLKEIAATLDDVLTKVMEELETKLKENDDGGSGGGHT